MERGPDDPMKVILILLIVFLILIGIIQLVELCTETAWCRKLLNLPGEFLRNLTT
jgi:uncharacterized protein YqhQ